MKMFFFQGSLYYIQLSQKIDSNLTSNSLSSFGAETSAAVHYKSFLNYNSLCAVSSMEKDAAFQPIVGDS